MTNVALKIETQSGEVFELELMVPYPAKLRIPVYCGLCRRPHFYLGASLRVCFLPCCGGKPEFTKVVVMGSNVLFSLTDGGTAGLFWGYTVTVIASIFTYLSIGEMASMYEPALHPSE